MVCLRNICINTLHKGDNDDDDDDNDNNNNDDHHHQTCFTNCSLLCISVSFHPLCLRPALSLKAGATFHVSQFY